MGKRALHNRERFYLATLQVDRLTVSRAASDGAQPRACFPYSTRKTSMQNGSRQRAARRQLARAGDLETASPPPSSARMSRLARLQRLNVLPFPDCGVFALSKHIDQNYAASKHSRLGQKVQRISAARAIARKSDEQ
jgi:hypothetical protein